MKNTGKRTITILLTLVMTITILFGNGIETRAAEYFVADDIRGYKFKIGDEVITTEGKVGKIISICDCDKCKARGFYEPFWVAEDSEWSRCISKFTAEDGFYGFYKIGKYRFNDFDKNSVLSAIDDCENRLKQLINLIGM